MKHCSLTLPAAEHAGLAGSSAVGSGDTVILRFNIFFYEFFYEGFVGNQAVYSAARDSGGNQKAGNR